MLMLAVCAAGIARPRKSDEERLRVEAEALRRSVAAARDSLQDVIAGRWNARERYVREREVSKERLSELRDARERSHAELSRVKEECFARERLLEDARVEAEAARDARDYLRATLKEVFAGESDKLGAAFPLDLERRREALERVRRIEAGTAGAKKALTAYGEYLDEFLSRGLEVRIVEGTVIVEDHGPEQLTIARFGTVFGYGINDSGSIFMIRPSGRGEGRTYRAYVVGEAELVEQLRELLPRWVRSETVSGEVPVDVLMNAQSGRLLAGGKSGAAAGIREYVRAGGPIMVPLLLLPLWALVLVILKLVQLSGLSHRVERAGTRVVRLLRDGQRDEARALVEKRRGPVAEIGHACLSHPEWDRASAEQTAREVLLAESPRLNRYLNSLAVIAGVAPLLGLLGTVTGMIELFEVITHYGTGDPKVMAGGISEALITTQTGLAVAIPLLLIHNYLRNRRNRIHAGIQQHAVEMINALWPKG